VAVLRRAWSGGAREGPNGGHDWLEVTELAPLGLDPVEVLVAPELVEPVALETPPKPGVAEVVVAEVVVAGVAAVVSVLRASAGSCPVTSTTVMRIQTAKNNAIDPPTTRARILRTRSRRCSLSLSPSCLVMAGSIGPRRSKGV
jgi:hypothetical protein